MVGLVEDRQILWAEYAMAGPSRGSSRKHGLEDSNQIKDKDVDAKLVIYPQPDTAAEYHKFREFPTPTLIPEPWTFAPKAAADSKSERVQVGLMPSEQGSFIQPSQPQISQMVDETEVRARIKERRMVEMDGIGMKGAKTEVKSMTSVPERNGKHTRRPQSNRST